MKDNQYAVVSKRNVRVFKPKTGKANAAFAILVRNREKDSLVSSIKQLESRFNSKYNYPYVLMNDEEFTEDFKTAINAATAADVQYGTIDKSMWGYPDFIDQKKAEEGRKHLSSKGIIYGMSESYRHMCRYFVQPIDRNASNPQY
jgi:alpha 1,2-mannosyltransferase